MLRNSYLSSKIRHFSLTKTLRKMETRTWIKQGKLNRNMPHFEQQWGREGWGNQTPLNVNDFDTDIKSNFSMLQGWDQNDI